MSAVPTPAPGVLVYTHPQGKTIHVHPNGSMDVFKPDGKRSTSSATPAKLAAGHGGWVLSSGSAPVAPIPEMAGTVAGASAPVTAMTYVEVDFTQVPKMLMDDTFAVEQKLDGARTLVHVKDGAAVFFGRNGQPLKHAVSAAHFGSLRPALESLPGEHVLDGEIMANGELWLFDLPQSTAGLGVDPSEPLYRRRAALEMLGDALTAANPKIRVVPQETDAVEKAKLLVRVEQAGGEGVMLKDLAAPYEGGVRVKHSVKAKFVKTADLVVLARDVKGKKNATLGVYLDDGSYVVEVGACSMIGKADAKVGDVVEVAYLNWTGEKLYQPRFMRIRDDKLAEDCLMTQFPEYSKGVLR